MTRQALPERNGGAQADQKALIHFCGYLEDEARRLGLEAAAEHIRAAKAALSAPGADGEQRLSA